MKKFLFVLMLPSLAQAGVLYNSCTGCIDYTGTTITSTTLPSGSTNYIRNTQTPQTGSTFYVDSGTVITQLDILGDPNIPGLGSINFLNGSYITFTNIFGNTAFIQNNSPSSQAAFVFTAAGGTGINSTATSGIDLTVPIAKVTSSATITGPLTVNGQAKLPSILRSLLATDGSGVIVSTTIVRSYSLYTSTADQTINTATPTTAHSSSCIGTTTVNANFFAVGSKFQIRGQGIYSTPLGNVATVTITVKYGATTLATVTTGSLPASATNLPFGLWIDCTVRAIGATGTMICNGSFFYDTALTGIVETQNALISGAVTVDTTAAKTIDTLGSWSATTTQTATVQQSSVLILN